MSHTSSKAAVRTAARVRREFIDFFVKRQGHTFVPSSPVVPHDDPTLLFTNAGMNQFKGIFLGQEERPYRRAANSQKCIRAGGKHNDLEDVGKDHYHHTFFEMLGNWSFGDYFKAEAIEWAWELLTGVWGLDPDRLYVTVFAGDRADGLEPDTEAEDLWKRFVPPQRISRWSRKDNFWEMGETGPCGPCSEIHYDFTPAGDGGDRVNAGDPAVIELWNLVFIQFNRAAGGALSALPAKHVDTGMGLERVTRVLQHKASNYDIDLFTPIFEAVERRTGAHPYRGTLEDPIDVAYRVIADHVRCLTAAITDGAWPGNEGRGYVLRRILRRAVRHAHQTLDTKGAWLHELVPAVVGTLGDAFPEMAKDPGRVAEVIRDEEESFLHTLDRGIALFEEAAAGAEGGVIRAGDAFRLHDTYGFPIDLTRVMAEERNLSVDEPGYERLMAEARQRSREAAGDKEEWTLPPEVIAKLKHLGIERTLDGYKYEAKPIDAELLAIWNGSDFDNTAHVGRRVALILHRTNHYAEAGGQVGDRGTLEADVPEGGTVPARGYTGREATSTGRFEVDETLFSGGYVLHVGRLTEGKLNVQERVVATVDRRRRESVRANHTATHLVNFALREVVGPEQDQRGSLVAPDRLRFDFTCPRAMSSDEIERTERIVNETIDARLPVEAEVVPLATARSIAGVRAIFGEKYPDPVRVVSIGAPLTRVLANPADERWQAYSIELCGGTHLRDTSGAAQVVILHEQALASGVRRVTAVTGAAALAAQRAGESLEAQAAAAEQLDDDALPGEFAQITTQLEELSLGAAARHRIEGLIEKLRGRVKALRRERAAESRAGIVEQARKIAAGAGGPVIVEDLSSAERDELLAAMDAVRAKHAESAVMLVGRGDGKVAIVARVPEALIARGLKAGDWVREAAKACGGSGGGRPDMAQAGGKEPDKVPEALNAARAFAERTIKD